MIMSGMEITGEATVVTRHVTDSIFSESIKNGFQKIRIDSTYE